MKRSLEELARGVDAAVTMTRQLRDADNAILTQPRESDRVAQLGAVREHDGWRAPDSELLLTDAGL
jgi:hypothetical protein